MTSPAPTASFHVFRVGPAAVPRAVARMALDRGPLRRTRGLRFGKLLGTGSGRTFTMRDADPTRWGLFAVWASRSDLDRFETNSSVLRGWHRMAVERWRVELRVLHSAGRWAGVDPFEGATADAGDGPVAALTRARIKWRLATQFWKAVPPVSAALHAQPGLRAAIGFGEAPVGLQGTLSIWDSAASLTDFAYRGAAHRAAIKATADRGWYAEELFARFTVVRSCGTIDGRNPLPGLGDDA